MYFIKSIVSFTILLLLSVCAGAQSKVLPDARPPGWTDTCVVFDDGTVINNIWYLRDVSPTAPFGNQNDYFEKVYQLIIRKIRISYANGDAYEGWVYVKNRAQWDSVLEGKSHCFCPILGTLYHAGSAEEQVFVAPKEMLAKKSVDSPVGRWRRVHNPGQVETLEFNANGTGVETIETRQKITIPLEGSDSRYDWWTGTRYPRQLTGGYDVNFTTRSSQTFRWERKGEYLTIKYSADTTITDTADNSYTWHDSVYTESGTYQWKGSTIAGCDSTVTLMLVIRHVGIEVIDGNGKKVRVYPNPTDGWLTIDADNILSIEVYDNTGRRVAEYGATNRIDLGHLPLGGYVLKIRMEKGVSIHHVIRN